MTRDEIRAKCIQVIKKAFSEKTGRCITDLDAAAALDSLNGIVTVNLPEATGEMIEAGLAAQIGGREIWDAMAAKGDLTNGPDGGK
jgi:hypothetical protein